jgi:hypothetical protein
MNTGRDRTFLLDNFFETETYEAEVSKKDGKADNR